MRNNFEKKRTKLKNDFENGKTYKVEKLFFGEREQ